MSKRRREEVIEKLHDAPVPVRRSTFQQVYYIATSTTAQVTATPTAPFACKSIQFSFGCVGYTSSAVTNVLCDIYCPELAQSVGAVAIGPSGLVFDPVIVPFSVPRPMTGDTFTFQLRVPSAGGVIPYVNGAQNMHFLVRMVFLE